MIKGNNRVVFLLGAGRSGTTLLYKLLSIHQNVAYLSNYQNRYPQWNFSAVLQRILNQFPDYKRKSWFKEHGEAYFNHRRKWLQSIVPTPSEAESVYASCGIPSLDTDHFLVQPYIAQCLKNKFECVRRLSGGEVLLSKRTANNRRIPILKHIFPDAKYIHLVKDGRSVAHSLLRVAWWDDHILYWTGKTPRQMVAEGSNPLHLAARNWVEEMHSLEKGMALIESKQILQVRYDELLKNPREQLQRMLDFMEITSLTETRFWEIVDSLKLEPRKEAWIQNWNNAELKMVLDLQRETLQRWGFETNKNL